MPKLYKGYMISWKGRVVKLSAVSCTARPIRIWYDQYDNRYSHLAMSQHRKKANNWRLESIVMSSNWSEASTFQRSAAPDVKCRRWLTWDTWVCADLPQFCRVADGDATSSMKSDLVKSSNHVESFDNGWDLLGTAATATRNALLLKAWHEEQLFCFSTSSSSSRVSKTSDYIQFIAGALLELFHVQSAWISS